jgi:hypothetical protein
MAEIILYLDDATEALLAEASERSGVSRSRWVAELIRRHVRDEWPESVRKLAGAFGDFPLQDSPTTEPLAADVPRVDG